MRITKIDNTTNLKAGQVCLQNVKSKNILSYDAIKNIAEDRNIDISIAKFKGPEYPLLEDVYSVIVSKRLPIIMKRGTTIGSVPKFATQFLTTRKETAKDELAVGIYNTTIKAIELLNKKLAGK